MAHPRGGGWLADDMAALAGFGFSTLVSALTDEEHHRLALAGVAEAARAAGLTYVEFPIVDRGVPDAASDADRLAEWLAAELLAGRSVVIHCWAAIGRSSLLAAATLVRLGVPPAETWRRISAARGTEVPGTAAQEAWLDAFAAGLSSGARFARAGRGAY
jgi:protein-tyrosine phosphatase